MRGPRPGPLDEGSDAWQQIIRAVQDNRKRTDMGFNTATGKYIFHCVASTAGTAGKPSSAAAELGAGLFIDDVTGLPRSAGERSSNHRVTLRRTQEKLVKAS